MASYWIIWEEGQPWLPVEEADFFAVLYDPGIKPFKMQVNGDLKISARNTISLKNLIVIGKIIIEG